MRAKNAAPRSVTTRESAGASTHVARLEAIDGALWRCSTIGHYGCFLRLPGFGEEFSRSSEWEAAVRD
eukprot:5149406-Pleurochrysis_carterae.AAC.1